MRAAAWYALAVVMILIELRRSRRRPPEADDEAPLTDRLMVIATALALVGAVVGPLVLPRLPFPATLAAIAGLAAGTGGSCCEPPRCGRSVGTTRSPRWWCPGTGW